MNTRKFIAISLVAVIGIKSLPASYADDITPLPTIEVTESAPASYENNELVVPAAKEAAPIVTHNEEPKQEEPTTNTFDPARGATIKVCFPPDAAEFVKVFPAVKDNGQ